MAKVNTVNNVVLDSGVRTVTFAGLTDHVFSKFRINPTDVKTGERAIETAKFFEDLKFDSTSVEKVVELQKSVEDKISYILGYDSAGDIFGEVSALTILPDGSIFVEHVIDKIMEVVKPAVEQRQKAMQKRADKYTAKYDGK